MAVSKRIIMKQKIQELKEMGLTKTEIIRQFSEDKEPPPSWPTVAKYYDMDDSESSSDSPFEKERVFDTELYRTVILEILHRNNRKLRISSIYDVLREKFVDTNFVNQLPGNEQTLRNYVHWLRGTGKAPAPESNDRVYQFVEEMPPGEQMLVDFGEQKVEDGITIHFMCMLLRFSRFLFVMVQDHKFNAAEACRGLYLCFKRIGGKVVVLVIDQDSIFIYEEKYGEIIKTQTFGSFLKEQDVKLFVCRKGDPESKGPVEKSVQFVKQNYFSARKLHTLQEVKAGIVAWMNRQNARIHKTTLQVPAEQLEIERNHLRPLGPSLYAMVENDFTIYEVKSMPYVRYKTNKYPVPKVWCYKSVKYKVVNDIIHIYDIVTGDKIIQHPIDKRKGITITSPEIKRETSTAWHAVATSLRVKYWTRSLDHFINGICKENPRYRNEQLQAVERFLDSHRPIAHQVLEQILSTCCDRFAYRVSEFEAIFLEVVQALGDEKMQLFALPTKPIPSVKVQQRGMESYAKAFRLMTTKQEGGVQ
ncbi:MAG: hypothetical protein WC239_09930 [Sphaerochaetaceae bacterium]